MIKPCACTARAVLAQAGRHLPRGRAVREDDQALCAHGACCALTGRSTRAAGACRLRGWSSPVRARRVPCAHRPGG
eukprot:3586315-Pleurochrysis_carterae.AAC.1